MIKYVIDGICNALYETFGDNYKIYTENVIQDLKEPCFFVLLVNPDNTLYLWQRHYRTNPFAVHYFPQYRNNPNAEFQDVLEKLYIALEYISLPDGLQRGTEINVGFSDGVMLFFVNYDFFVDTVTDEDLMETQTTTINVNGGA
jgi:hypothetical protein